MRFRLLTLTAAVCAAAVVAGGIHTLAQTSTKPAQTSTKPDRKDYDAALWSELHFAPAIDRAKDEQCLACHSEILNRKPRAKSPAGVEASKSIAWYQAADTYSGNQETFHWRHISSPFAKDVMKLSCNFCHRGHDPREEAPGSSATSLQVGKGAGFTLRKTVDPSNTCLRCHGSFPFEIMQLPGPWPEIRPDMESEDVKNGCLGACHQDTFRTNRHNVTYLNRDKIEELAKQSSDVCFGCHGGRAWYRNSYPYPRHPWPGMDEEEVPEWAKNRPTQSEARYRIKAEAGTPAKSEKNTK